MSKEREQLTHLYDDKGNFLGVFVSEELWTRTKDKIAPIFHAAIPQKQSERKEPMADWEALKNYWDFKYPINYEVKCDLCGSETQDWTQDDPRKFKLLACNIGGLVRFSLPSLQWHRHKTAF